MDYGVSFYRSRRRLLGTKKEEKPVKKGDVILTSEPFAHIIDYEYISMYCDYCIRCRKGRLLQRCQGCRTVWYCNQECREAATDSWHKWECPALRRLKQTDTSLPQDFVRLMARVIFRLRDGGDKYVEKYTEREGRRFRDLMNHYADLKKDEYRKCDADYLIDELKKYIGDRIIPNYSDFLGVYGRMLVNRFSFMEDTMLNIGSALYLAASIFDHACHPNCFITFQGRSVQIRSLVDMPVLDYSKFRISYVDPVSSVNSRRQDLYNKWFFWCDCRVCHDKDRANFENSVRCGEYPEGTKALRRHARSDNWASSGFRRRANAVKIKVNTNCQAPVYIPETSDGSWQSPWEQTQQLANNTPSTTRGGKENEKNKTTRVTEISTEEKCEPSSYRTFRNTLTTKQEDDKKHSESKPQGEQHKECNEEDKEGETAEGRRAWACSLCGCEVSSETVTKYQEAVAFTREKLNSMTEENPTLEYCLEILEKQGDIFSSMNVWRVRTLDFAFNAAMFNGCWILALKYGEDNVNGMRFYYGADHPTYALFLFKLGKAKIYFKEFREGVKLLEEAETQLTLGFGPSHPIIEDLHLVSMMANEDVDICIERRIAAAKKREEKEQQKQLSYSSCRDDVIRKLFPIFNGVA